MPLQHQIVFLKLDWTGFVPPAETARGWALRWWRALCGAQPADEAQYSSLWGSAHDMLRSTNVPASVAASAQGERDAARRWCCFITHYLKWQRATLEFGLPAIFTVATLGDGWRLGGSQPFHLHSRLYWNVCRDESHSFTRATETFSHFWLARTVIRDAISVSAKLESKFELWDSRHAWRWVELHFCDHIKHFSKNSSWVRRHQAQFSAP